MNIWFLMCYTFLCYCFPAFAQNTENNWYFGYNAGLNFAAGNPVYHNNNPMQTNEGSASISDAVGNLLFYTNGVDVYNSNHQFMQNGSALEGHISSSQSALIVQDPGDSLEYYIFTVGAQIGAYGGNSGLAWTKVDMRQNGGLGAVTRKNIHLQDSTSEKLSAAMHHNGKYVWVIVHKWESDNYLAYLVTCDSILGPVKSATGNRQGLDLSGLTSSAIGCMKVNPQATKIASVWNQFHTYNSNYYSYAFIEICDFDNRSGKITKAKLVTHGLFQNAYKQSYGLSFSPSGKYLYAGIGDYTSIARAALYQYDATANVPSGTEKIIYAGPNLQSFGTQQLAPDGRIYIARTNGAKDLSEIRSPDSSGLACDFRYTGVSLGNNISTWGLPNNWNKKRNEIPTEIFNWEDTTICSPGVVQLNAYLGYDLLQPKYLWNTGSRDSIIYVETPGIYSVRIFLLCDTLFDSVLVKMYPGSRPQLGEDIRIPCFYFDGMIGYECDGCSYYWNTGETSAYINAPKPGEYKIYVTDSSGCTRSDSINLFADFCECDVYFPSAFTPNGDGINDYFLPMQDCALIKYKLEILNRWGQIIFSSENPTLGWDGKYKSKEVMHGNYRYLLQLKTEAGNRLQEQVLTGVIVLIR